MAAVMRPDSGGLALQPAALRDAVGLVTELLWPQLVEVPEDVGLEDVGVQRRHPVDGMAAHNG
jgi:hypothetical protein